MFHKSKKQIIRTLQGIYGQNIRRIMLLPRILEDIILINSEKEILSKTTTARTTINNKKPYKSTFEDGIFLMKILTT